MHYLALSSSGAVDEGELIPLASGAFEADMKRYDGDSVVRVVERFDVETDGVLRARTWTVEGQTRNLWHDERLTKLAPK